MYYCNCGAPVRAIYLEVENIHEPDDVCHQCHDENIHLQQLVDTREMLQEDIVSMALTLAQVNQELTKLRNRRNERQSANIEEELPF